MLRIKVNADGTYAIPRGNLFPEGMHRTRPEIYAMGFRNPFRIQVDSDDVAYVTDYSPDSRAPGQLRGPAGTGRVEIVRKPSNYGWPMCYGPNLPMYLWDFNTSTSLRRAVRVRRPGPGPANTSRWNTGLRHGPPITQPDIWYSYNDNATPPQGTPCLAYYDGSGGTCPQLFPELGTGGVGPHGAAKYEFDPANPSETKFPPYFDGAMILGEFTRDYLREVRIDSKGGIQKINNVLNCGAFGAAGGLFECDNPMDMQFGADGSFYLLTYGDGFFVANPDAGLYRFDYVAGAQRPRAVMNATPTNGVAPLTVQFSSDGSNDPDENDSISFEWDFGVPGTDADRLDRPEPVVHVHGQRRLHGAADRDGLDRQVAVADDPDHRRQHRADGDGQRPGRRRLLRVGRQHPVHGDGHRPAGRRRSTAAASPSRSCSCTTSTGTARRRRRAARACCRRRPTTPRTAATSPAASTRPTRTRAAPAAPRR